MNVVLSFFFNHPFIAYFLKKNYSLRQYILKILRVWERSLTSVPNWCLFGSYWSWDLIGNRQHEGLWRFAKKRVTGRCTGLRSPASGQFIGGEPAAMEWPDSAIQRPVRRRSCIRSIENEGDRVGWTLAVSGQWWSDVSGRDSRGFGPRSNRLDSGW